MTLPIHPDPAIPPQPPTVVTQHLPEDTPVIEYPPEPTPAALPAAPPAPAPAAAPAKPRPKPLFKLADLDDEAPTEPFVFEHDGDVFEFLGPKALDWQDVQVVQDNPGLMVHVLLNEEDRKVFLTKRVSIGLLQKLMERWRKHFGVPDAGEAGGSVNWSPGTQSL